MNNVGSIRMGRICATKTPRSVDVGTSPPLESTTTNDNYNNDNDNDDNNNNNS